MKAFAAAEWERAGRALASARHLVASDPDSAASRAYYAAFHGLTALFALRGQTFTKHAAVRAALHRDLVGPGDLPPECGRDYDFLMDLRETGDYGGLVQVSADSARRAAEKAAGFLKVLREACPEVGQAPA
jgi:uncharacterized protein (UPF0332 family)